METASTSGKLTVTRRTGTGKEMARKLRAQGLVPGICYGQKQESIPITLDPLALHKTLDPAKRQNTLIELTLQDGPNNEQCLVMLKNYQVHPLKRSLVHADFIRVAKDQPITVEVPLILDGKPEGVKTGGTLHQVFRGLPVQCTPDKIPVSIKADVSNLQLNETLSVKDVTGLEEGMSINLPPNQTIALVMAAKKVVAETTTTEGAEVEGAAGGDKAAPAAEAKGKGGGEAK